MKSKTISLILILLYISSIPTLLFITQTNNTIMNNNYKVCPRMATTHGQISISGNAELETFCVIEGSGSGTKNDPYIIKNFEITISVFAPGIYIENTDVFLIIQDCTVQDGDSIPATGIFLDNCSNILITTNVVKLNWDGIRLKDSENNSIIDNECSFNEQYGISLQRSNNSIIVDNTVNYNEYGIISSQSSHCIISNNYLEGNDYGIECEGVENEISNNFCFISVFYGFTLNTINSTIINNTLWSNNFCGIYLRGDENILSDNVMEYNKQHGLWLSGASNNFIIGNNCTNNVWDGINLASSSNGNHIWVNIFSDNSNNQTYCESSTGNVWNNDLLGNYYGDYLTQNPTASANGSLWDLPYLINGTTSDNDIYPLMDETKSDIDDDGLLNYEEFYFNTNLTNNDSDYDEMPDLWEVQNNLNPINPNSGDDPDVDLLNNIDEYTNNTDPHNPDSDDDGMPDGWEVQNALNPNSDDAGDDPDNDDYTNLQEYINNTDPHEYDEHEEPDKGILGYSIFSIILIMALGMYFLWTKQKIRFN